MKQLSERIIRLLEKGEISNPEIWVDLDLTLWPS
jgi:hypothetical protein